MQASGGDSRRRLAKRQDDLHADQEPGASERDELRGPAGEGLTQAGSTLPGVQTRDRVLGVRGQFITHYVNKIKISRSVNKQKNRN